MSVTREEQRRAEIALARQRYEQKDMGGFSGKQVLDLSLIGGYKKELFYRPKDGENHIDILPYVVKTDKHPSKVKPGYTDHLLELWVHRRVGPSQSTFLCIAKHYGKACPICEERDELKKNPSTPEDEINALYPKRRCWYNVVNLDLPEKDQIIQIFEEAQYLFEREILAKAGVKKDGFVTYWDLELGATVNFRATKKGSVKGPYFEYRIDAFEERQPYGESILQETFALDELIVVPTYEEVRNAYHGISDEDKPEKKSEPVAQRGERSVGRCRETEPAQEPVKEGRRLRRQPEEQTEPDPPKENPCPNGHDFGKDNDEFKDCGTCEQEVWDDCDRERQRLEQK